MNLSSSISQPIFGCLELDSAGIILHTKIEADGIFGKSRTTLVGQNFFDEMDCLADTEELRARFNQFVNSRQTAEKFTFHYTVENGEVNARVVLSQLDERDFSRQRQSVLIDIRKV